MNKVKKMSSENVLSKTGLIASPRKQIKRINKISKQDSVAANLLKCTVTKPVQFSLRPFGGLFNPYSKGCSILCNHPGPNDIKTVVKHAKEMWLHEGSGQKTTMQQCSVRTNCVMMMPTTTSSSSSACNRNQQNGYHHYHNNHELMELNDMIPEHIPEEFFRRYTGSDSRPLTPTPTVVSGRTRTSTGSHLNNRRCFTPEPTNSSCAKERKQLILDLRRSHSQETLFWNASSDLSPGTGVQQQTGSNMVGDDPTGNQRLNSSVGKQSTRNQRLCEQEARRKSAEKKAHQQKLAAENEAKSTVQSTTICINERDMDEDEDGPRRRGKRKKKGATKSQTQTTTTTTFHLNNNQEPETQIATLGPDSLNPSGRPSLIPNGNNIPRLSLVMTDNLYGGYSATNPLIGGTHNMIGSSFQSSFINEDTLKILRRGLNVDIVESTFERCMNRALTEALRTIPTEKINYESEALKQFKESLTITNVDNEKWLNMPRKYTRKSARFTLPINTNDLSKMTPLEYVSKHIWISDYRKQLYKYVFQKYLPELQTTNSPQIRTPSTMTNVHRNTTLIIVNNEYDDDDDDSDDNYSGQQSIKQKKKLQQNHKQQFAIEERKISFTDLVVALQNVLGYHGTLDKIEMIKTLLKLTDQEMKFPFRTWCGIVAFAERYLNELSHDQDPCDEASHLLRDLIDGVGGDTKRNKDTVDHGAEERRAFQKEIERHFNEKRDKSEVEEELVVVVEKEEEEEERHGKKLPKEVFYHTKHGELIDWHDWEFIAYEKSRTGLGEQGEAGTLPAELSVLRQEMYDHNGFNALLSDKISLNRSVPDIRHKDCVNLKYLSKLPTVSVVVPFYNEHFSTLLRTCYSVLNRSPKHLIHEIVLVDDCSNRENLKQELDDYLREHLPKVRVVRLDRRSGLITARLAGAKVATGHVLLFLDSHTEPNVNWLPPLLDPIARNYRVCVCPLIDVIAHESFKYTAQDEGQRGGFDWQFFYKRFPKLPEDLKHPTQPFKSPVMAGGLFAISSKFFWELGGYDEGLDIWGGEQYELSFKIWQCGGEMYDVPCSRVGHIYRGPQIKSNENPRNYDFVHKNYKRVAEVWMDEYKNYIYARDAEIYENVDAGDLTKQKAIREKLQCKPFKWFMEEVAFDLPLLYPPIEPLDIAYGAIQNLAHPHLCLDTLNHPQHEPVGLYWCAENLKNPQHNQYFFLTWREDIRNKYKSLCFDVSAGGPDAEIILYECHGQKGNQEWHYDIEKQWLIQGTLNSRGRCMDMNKETMKVFMNPCDETNENMRWKFGFYNESSTV